MHLKVQIGKLLPVLLKHMIKIYQSTKDVQSQMLGPTNGGKQTLMVA